MIDFKILGLFSIVLGFATCQTLYPIELDELLNGEFKHNSINATWISDTALVFEEEDGYYKYDVPSKTRAFLFGNDVLANYPGGSATVTKDAEFAVIQYNVKAIFRHSVTAQYAIYDIINNVTYDVANKEFLQMLVWSTEGNHIVYIFENNVYYMASPSSQPQQITFDGIPGVVYNGITDWVYEEEILYSGQAVWFSPNGDKLAFATFNDTEVPEFTYLLYGKPGRIESQYPEVVKLRYPKVGIINPTFALKVVDLTTPQKEPKLCNATSDSDKVEDFILTHVTWATNDEVVAVVQNREQTTANTMRCGASEGVCQIETTLSEPVGWLTATGPEYNRAGTMALYVMPQPEGQDFFNHITLYNVASFRYERLTSGRRVVGSVLGWDEVNNLVYYTSSAHDNPSQNHAYVVNVDTKDDTCLTCDFNTPEGLCVYGTALISTNYSFIIKRCAGPGPNYGVVEGLTQTIEPIVWEANEILRSNLSERLSPKVKDFVVDLPSGFKARARLLLPPDLDEAGIQKYPMIVNVYGGPDSNKVTDQFSLGIQNYWITKKNYIYAYIDGRGSGRNGNHNMFQVYKNLATAEIEDQILVTKYLQDNLPYIDAQNTAIWGWSYGGFATAWVLVQDIGNVFKSGLSVAPVTNFAYYDSMYTERYMGLLSDNEIGYNNTDLMSHVEGFRNKTFFLIHGNADDNVHYQQSMHLARALQLEDIPFLQQSYPDENHALGGVLKHLYHTIDKFWGDTISFRKE